MSMRKYDPTCAPSTPVMLPDWALSEFATWLGGQAKVMSKAGLIYIILRQLNFVVHTLSDRLEASTRRNTRFETRRRIWLNESFSIWSFPNRESQKLLYTHHMLTFCVRNSCCGQQPCCNAQQRDPRACGRGHSSNSLEFFYKKRRTLGFFFYFLLLRVTTVVAAEP